MRIHGPKMSPGRGSAAPVEHNAARKTSAKGQPNRKRTWVAPSGAKLACKLALGRVAHGLCGSGDDREDRPQPSER